MAKKKRRKSRSHIPITKNPHMKRQSIARRLRRRAVSTDLIRGQFSVQQLAVKYSVSTATISNDVSAIQDEWEQADNRLFERHALRRQARIEQLLETIRESYEEWERSKEPAMTKTVKVQSARCRKCAGSGRLKNPETSRMRKCGYCDGKGKLSIEDETTTIKGQTGNPAYLQTVQAAIKEISQLEGLRVHKTVVEGDVHHDHSGSVTHAVLDVGNLPIAIRRRVLAAIEQQEDSGEKIGQVTAVSSSALGGGEDSETLDEDEDDEPIAIG